MANHRQVQGDKGKVSFYNSRFSEEIGEGCGSFLLAVGGGQLVAESEGKLSSCWGLQAVVSDAQARPLPSQFSNSIWI